MSVNITRTGMKCVLITQTSWQLQLYGHAESE